MPEVLDLGLIQAMHKGAEAPTNPDLLWLDTATNRHRYYDTASGEWLQLSRERQEFTLSADELAETDGEATLTHTLSDQFPLVQVISAGAYLVAANVTYGAGLVIIGVQAPFFDTRVILRT